MEQIINAVDLKPGMFVGRRQVKQVRQVSNGDVYFISDIFGFFGATRKMNQRNKISIKIKEIK